MEPVALDTESSNGDAANGRESSAPWNSSEHWPEPALEYRISSEDLHSGPDGGFAATCASDNSLLHQLHPTLSGSQHMYSGGHDTGGEFNSLFDPPDDQLGRGIIDPGQFMSMGSSSGAGRDAGAYPLHGAEFLLQLRGSHGQRGGGVSRQQQSMPSMGVADFHHSMMQHDYQQGFPIGNEALDALGGVPGLLAHNGTFPISYSMQGNARQGTYVGWSVSGV